MSYGRTMTTRQDSPLHGTHRGAEPEVDRRWTGEGDSWRRSRRLGWTGTKSAEEPWTGRVGGAWLTAYAPLGATRHKQASKPPLLANKKENTSLTHHWTGNLKQPGISREKSAKTFFAIMSLFTPNQLIDYIKDTSFETALVNKFCRLSATC